MRFNIPGLASNAVVEHAQSGNTSSPASVSSHDIEKKEPAVDSAADFSDDDSINKVDESAPRGVQIAQAMTQVWSRRDLILAYVL